ncbi:MAG: TIGR04372 family glycosyltransferase, partial [Actinomycetota bacterium]|nr:TIGR04372 family glycosyltransferase [Actinomycetota bacterium]
IENYIPAVAELTRRGCFAFRMGAVVNRPLEQTNPMIIDYAANGSRTDFLDIYLAAKCRFFIGDTAGIYAVPAIFRRPIAFANFIPLEHAHTWGQNDLFIPKLLWLRGESRFLTFKEIFDNGIGRFLEADQYERMGIDSIENTPEDIAALVVEVDERLRGTWKSTPEDEELQRRFWSLFNPSELHGEKMVSRIGADFLRTYRDLLD